MSKVKTTEPRKTASPAGQRELPCYVIVARRWGEDESHHYIVGKQYYFDKELAEKMARFEENQRGGKYECTVEKLMKLKEIPPRIVEMVNENWERLLA